MDHGISKEVYTYINRLLQTKIPSLNKKKEETWT